MCAAGRGVHLTSSRCMWVQGVYVERVMLDPYPMTPGTFAQRMREVDPATSAAIFWELKEAGVIRPDNYSSFLEYESWCEACHGAGPLHHHRACLQGA